MDWLGAVSQLRREGEAGVLVTVTAVRGHAPRDPGAKMVVSPGRTWGSVGGGNLEQTAIDRARELLRSGATVPETQELRLNDRERTEHGRQCCGGVVTLLLEPLPARPTVAVFGLGHVGYELARILCRLELSVHLVDGREAELDPLRLADVTEGVADVAVHHALVGETVLERLPRGAHVLVMTHDHAEDFALCDAALRLGDRLGSVGLIGSSAKWARFRRLLAAEGHDEATIATITSPVGLPDIAGKDPAVIAVSVAAALLQTLSHRPPSPSTSSGHVTERPLSLPKSEERPLSLPKGEERPLSLSKGPDEHPHSPSTSSGHATERPHSPSTSSGHATERPHSPSTSSGHATERPHSPSTSSGHVTERPLSPSTSSGHATERSLSPSTSSGHTAEHPLSPSTSSGHTAERPLSLSKGPEGVGTP